MFTCHRCRVGLVRTKTPKGFAFVCPKCRGRGIGLPVLRRTIEPACISELWQHAADALDSDGKPCPICRRPMHEVPVTLDDHGVLLDLCKGCQFVWFDTGELDELPQAPVAVASEPMSDKAREAVALARLRLDELRHANDADEGEPEEPWQWIPAVLGMPVELDARPVQHKPWLIVGLAAVLAIVYLLTAGNLDQAFHNWGFIPAQRWRMGGLTFFTCFFVHVGLFHLAGNLYFLLVFGRHVEDYLGMKRCALLLMLATCAGGMLHGWLDSRADIPCGGASGGISGLIIFYALRFPHARLGLFLRFGWYFQWCQMSALAAVGFWIALQLTGAFVQVQGIDNVSYLGHLGGATVGLAAWLLWFRHD